MDNSVSWLIELQIQSGREGDFRAMREEMISAARANEPGTLNYEWSVSADGRTCHIHERYADSDAAMVHLGNFNDKYAERFFAILTPVRFGVYGSPDGAVKQALAGVGAVFMHSVGGFHR